MVKLKNFLTFRHKKYWKDRQIDWKQAYFTPDHVHRDLIIKALSHMSFGSVLEIGCGAGANLYNIKRHFPLVEVGGIDISKDAIDMCNKLMPDAAVFEVASADKMFLQDKSSDVVLSDACLIYIDPLHINKVIKEIKRVSRKYVLFVEFHSPRWWNRFVLRLLDGYNAYNYKTLLEKHGFYGVEIYKIKDKEWPGWGGFGYVIAAKTP